MRNSTPWLAIQTVVGAILAMVVLGTTTSHGQSVAVKETAAMVQRAARLPGVWRRSMLLGVVDNDSDKTLASVRAREVHGVFSVENDLAVSRIESGMTAGIR